MTANKGKVDAWDEFDISLKKKWRMTDGRKWFSDSLGEYNFPRKIGCINIKNNVFVGENTTILYDVTFSLNTVIAACSYVNEDLPGNEVYGDIPVKYIFSFNEFAEKRKNSADRYKEKKIWVG